VQHAIKCEHGWWYNFYLPQIQFALLMLIVSNNSLVTPTVGGVSGWNISPPKSNRDITCDL